MQVLRKNRPKHSLIHKASKMLNRVNNPAMMQEKKKGIKRQIATDNTGCLLEVVAHKANQHDIKIGDLDGDVCFLRIFDDKEILCRWRLSQNFYRSGQRIFWILSKNYEYTMSSAETMIKLSHIHTLIKRL